MRKKKRMKKTKKLLYVVLVVATCVAMVSCNGDRREQKTLEEDIDTMEKNYDLEVKKGNKRIALAGGCFWGTEEYVRQLPGVVRTFVGYANGKTEAPSYEDVCTGETGHAETVFVEYNPNVIELKYLLKYFFETINPTLVNRQGNDVGSQYRSGIYYFEKKDKPEIEAFLKREQKNYIDKIQTEVLPLDNMYPAEEYHQNYLMKNPNGYCHVTFETLPKEGDKLTDGERKKTGDTDFDEELWKYEKPTEDGLNELPKISYEVTQNKATESPFSSPYDQEFGDGIYVDITTGQPLFSSKDKYDAGCGWPSFTRPIEEALIEEEKDTSHGMIRTEVLSDLSGAHLGHVFNDGPKKEGGLRYCINGAALRFVPKEDMEKEGYGYLLKLFQ